MTRKDGKTRMDMLDWAAENYSPPDQQTNDGPASSPRDPGSRPRLNPAFTFWLMGVPWWWGNPEPISFAQQAMGFALYKQQLQSSLCFLVSELPDAKD